MRAGTTPILEKNAPRMEGQMRILHVSSHQFRESLWELLRELWFSYCSSRGMPFREWNFVFREWNSNSESCSESTPERSQSSENGLFAPRAFFLKLGWSSGFCSTVSTPNSVSFLALTEFRRGSSVSSSQPTMCVCQSELTEFFSQNSLSLPQNSLSSLFRNCILETVFRPFPKHSCTPTKS